MFIKIEDLKLKYKIMIPVLIITTFVILIIAVLISAAGSGYIKNEKIKEIGNLAEQYSIRVEQNIGNVMT